MLDNLKVNANEYLPLRDVVFQTLRKAILVGEFKPGERLMEIALADKLGVSRTPVREAIRKLELEGLVVMIPRKGAEVASITEKDLRDVLEVRCALEELAAQLACEKITEEGVVKLEESVEGFKKAIQTKDLTTIVEKDVAFHDIIFQIGENERLIQIVNNLREQMYRYRFEYLKDISCHQGLIEEHRMIYESIVKKDKEAASQAAKLHIDNQEKAIVQQIRLEKEKHGNA